MGKKNKIKLSWNGNNLAQEIADKAFKKLKNKVKSKKKLDIVMARTGNIQEANQIEPSGLRGSVMEDPIGNISRQGTPIGSGKKGGRVYTGKKSGGNGKKKVRSVIDFLL